MRASVLLVETDSAEESLPNYRQRAEMTALFGSMMLGFLFVLLARPSSISTKSVVHIRCRSAISPQAIAILSAEHTWNSRPTNVFVTHASSTIQTWPEKCER